jgi:branched-chain amino acid transport system ATP-binding protein
MANLLVARNLTKNFGGVRAVDGVSLDVGADEIVGIIGPNGAGKTTLLNLLSGVIRPTAGDIEFDGRDVTHLAPHRFVAVGIARTFQNLALFQAGTVLDNILVGFHSRICSGILSSAIRLPSVGREESALRLEAEALAAMVGLADVLLLPVGTLSYGQRKRVELARALASKPRLLLLDELISGMNLQEKHNIADCIFDIRRQFGCAIAMIEHDLGFVTDISDRIYVLNFGAGIAAGVPAEVVNNPAVVSAYVGRYSAAQP